MRSALRSARDVSVACESSHEPSRHLRDRTCEDVLSFDVDADVLGAALLGLARLAEPVSVLGRRLSWERRVGHVDDLADLDTRLNRLLLACTGLLLPPQSSVALSGAQHGV